VPRIVVLGCGNQLRRDDAAGWRVASAIEQNWGRLVVVRRGQQLVPEWAADLAEADVAYIVDASLTCGGRPRLRRLRLTASAGEPLLDAHALGASQLVSLAGAAFGRAPRAYLLHVPVQDLHFGNDLSGVARRGVVEAIALLDRRVAAILRLPRRVAPLCTSTELRPIPGGVSAASVVGIRGNPQGTDRQSLAPAAAEKEPAV
jgi:hydrogenase maturation protease